jgi:methanogenic corrinoid protein MtbC1
MTASDPDRFAAELLERSGTTFAGYAADLLLESNPGIGERFGPDAFSGWKNHLSQRILELAAALRAADPAVFVTRALWNRKAFLARGRTVEDLQAALESLQQILTERLPVAARDPALRYLRQGIAALAKDAAEPAAPELDPARALDRVSLSYLHKILSGDLVGAIEDVVSAVDNGLDVRDAYCKVLLPAEREVGRLWHIAEVKVAEEHLVSFAIQRTMAILAHRARAAPPNGKTAVIAAVASNAHDIGLRAVADLYQLAGWRAIFLGADVPAADLPAILDYFQADVLLLGATLAPQVSHVTEAIEAIRSECERPVQIIVGGTAFDEATELWKRAGADGYAADVETAVPIGARLVGLSG